MTAGEHRRERATACNGRAARARRQRYHRHRRGIPMSVPRPAAVARPLIHEVPGSRIREVANEAIGDPSVLPFWFGEPDCVTPAAIREAAKRALDDGDTFYHHNLGLPALRE